MNIQSLHLQNFMSHADTRLRVPARGVVLIVGANGSGKSSLGEAVSFALSGKTLRGTSPWAGDDGVVSVETDALAVTRRRVKGRVSLTWNLHGSPPLVFDTAAKAQAALDGAVMPHEVWRRSSVFSSADATHFTLASDAERKRLLESVLGLQQFEIAHEIARKELRVAELAQAQAKMARAAAEAAHSTAVLAAEAAREDHAAVAVAPETLETAARVAHDATLRYEDLCSEAREVAAALKAAHEERASALLRVRDSALTAQRYAKTACGTCGQPFPDLAVRRAQLAQAHNEEVAAKAEVQRLDAVIAGLERMNHSVNADADAASLDASALRSVHGDLIAKDNASRTAERARERAMETERVAVERADAARVEEAHTDAELAECVANAHLFSRTGVRAQLLNGALQGIETIADGWLARLAANGRPLHLALKSYTEKSSGAVSEAISLEIVGAGNGLGYKAASGGERQRVNAALCFALGEVAAAAYGVAPGTLILDELFESLDTQGAAAVCGVLTDLAQDRAVFLITHRDDLVAQLKPAVIWRVASGVVTEETP